MLDIRDLGTMEYRQAWSLQETLHAQVVAGDIEKTLIVEHPPVITIGRRPEGANNLLTARQDLTIMGVDLVHSDRGGDITFHGPGQVVIYPIIRLNDHALSVGAYVRELGSIAIAAAKTLGIPTWCEDKAIGVWADRGKICAIGVRIRRGTSLHGLAFNVTTDLRYFNLIVPCGLTGRRATSVQEILGDATPPLATVKQHLITALTQSALCR